MAMQSYSGSCHCGAVKFEAKADLDNTLECNCSRCRRLGLILTFTPADQFKLRAGEAALVEYQFNKHIIHHLFCKTCGVQAFAHAVAPDGKPMAAINVRCLEGVDVSALTPRPWDGASQ